MIPVIFSFLELCSIQMAAVTTRNFKYVHRHHLQSLHVELMTFRINFDVHLACCFMHESAEWNFRDCFSTFMRDSLVFIQHTLLILICLAELSSMRSPRSIFLSFLSKLSSVLSKSPHSTAQSNKTWGPGEGSSTFWLKIKTKKFAVLENY